MTRSEKRKRLFRTLDRLFWLVWALFPVMIWLNIRSLYQVDLEGVLTPSQQACVESLPTIQNMPALPRAVFWGQFAVQYLFYAAMIAVAHAAIRRFSHGRMLVDATLRSFRRLGALIVIWSVYSVFADNTLLYALFVSGATQKFVPTFAIDLTVFAVGAFIMAFTVVLDHALALQNEVDLTV